MNEFLKHLNRIEFVVTLACTGNCRHCQNGDPLKTSEHIDAQIAARAIQRAAERYRIETVMTFGGEPLLYPDTVCAIHETASQLGIEKRQVITNGYCSKNPERIGEVARRLAESGVNDLLLSVDAFHQETIPLGPVLQFAQCAARFGIPVRLSPAWLVSEEDGNPYNRKTREILKEFEPLGIPADSGNIIFPSGNALRYLREYFEDPDAPSPYDEDPRDVRSLSFSPNGDVLGGNIYKTDLLEILEHYQP